jgi:D-beta-D-heptose 7-phosphate kinase / D-beta-D-heptose 1-phosphate adenosyltransferase
MQDHKQALRAIEGMKILVAGDLMLDQYVHGKVERLSPEAPVPVLSIQREEFMPGGAGNVLSNLCGMGAKPAIFSVTGDDAPGEKLKKLLEGQGADVSGVVKDPARPTILKTRYVDRGSQLMRGDLEKTDPLSPGIEQKLWTALEGEIKDAKALILSDYGKGVLSPAFLQKIIRRAKEEGLVVLVDPKGADYARYRGADVVTPNRKELAEASGADTLSSDVEIESAAKKIITSCGIKYVVATRSEDGLSVIGESQIVHVRTDVKDVFDVSGAGDTVIATLAAFLGTGMDIVEAAKLANIAAGIAVSKVGTAPVKSAELREALSPAPQGLSFQAKIAASEDFALARIQKWKAQGCRVGMTGGCFDILHYGHVQYLNEARAQCDRLIVALNRDASVKLLKGADRPVNDETARAHVLAALSFVDMVVLFGAEKAGEDNTPAPILARLQPDVFFKGGDYTPETLPETPVIRAYGGEVAIMQMHEGYSTTAILTKSRKLA